MNASILKAISLAALTACALPLFAQDEPVIDPSQLVNKTASRSTLAALKAAAGSTAAHGSIVASTPAALPLWQYSLVSPIDGHPYSGAVVGGNPFNRGARTTTLQIVLVPLRIALTGTVRNFDPTSPDTDCLGSSTAFTLTQQSPLFNTVPNFMMNGINMGTVTYPDAIQRAQFWSSVSSVAPAYHLGMNVTVAPVQTITTANDVNSHAASYSFSGTCGVNSTDQDNPVRYAAIDINYLDAQLINIVGSLGLTANQFPLFVIYKTIITEGPPGALNGNCCILGYHSTTDNVPANAPGQTYGIGSYFSPTNIFGGVGSGTSDISALSHEVMEWINDPSGVNLTPEWGNIGQVGGCMVSGASHTAGQNNFEVGDPLSGNYQAAISMPNGVTYHPQEEAFFSWFFGGTSYGSGGKYSSNGTFSGFAIPCASGGGTH